MKILLTTLHAKYSHASLALPCLAVRCRTIPGVDVVIREWTANESREHVLRRIMAEGADLVAFSCYIWNIEKTLRIAADIKQIAGDTLICLGGPEASFGVFELMHANPAVDFVVKGEGEAVFQRLVEALADGGTWDDIENLFFRDGDDIGSGPLTREHLLLDTIPSPFAAGLVDLHKPLIYYETSRGCPFNCAFCLSSVEGAVRSFSMGRIESDLLFLMRQEVGYVKLVDRTFNYDAQRANRIWAFILEHNRGSHFHFEISADLLTAENLALLSRVPEHTFRFEIGIQSTSEETLQQVGRTGSLDRIFDNVRRLRAETRVELHLDLVAGLPAEDYAGFLDSLRQVAELAPHEIQIEPLKVLKGSPMREIARSREYRFSDFPPYTILATPWLSFQDIGRIETIGRLLDLFHNHGGFAAALVAVLPPRSPSSCGGGTWDSCWTIWPAGPARKAFPASPSAGPTSCSPGWRTRWSRTRSGTSSTTPCCSTIAGARCRAWASCPALPRIATGSAPGRGAAICPPAWSCRTAAGSRRSAARFCGISGSSRGVKGRRRSRSSMPRHRGRGCGSTWCEAGL